MGQIKVLGAYGTKGESNETTCIEVNATNVIDAGNLLKGLGESCALIETIWLTHSHLDHISDIAYILDAYFDKRTKPLRIAGLPQTIKILQKHFLNELIWPDFSKIKLLDGKTKAVEYFPIKIGKQYQIGENEYIEPFKTNHTVPSCGYIVTMSNREIAITADTYISFSIWDIINKRHTINALIIECSFESDLEELAQESKHLTPRLLNNELTKLTRPVTLYINHIKPNSKDKIVQELAKGTLTQNAKVLNDYETVIF